MENKKTFVVPWDFSPVADYALAYANMLAKCIEGNIMLLHIVKKEGELHNAEPKLKQIAEENQKKTSVETVAVAKEGSIFTTIAETVNEIEAEMVIMGTHGIKGSQKFFGSYALKVIANSKVPFLVVQDFPSKENIERILFPVSFKRETKESIGWITYLDKYFKLHITMLAARYSDPKLKKGVSSNVLFTQKILDKKAIPYEIHYTKNKGDFTKQVMEMAPDYTPDVILMMNVRDISLADFIVGITDQNLLANGNKIPVMCINPKPLKNVGSFSAGGG